MPTAEEYTFGIFMSTFLLVSVFELQPNSYLLNDGIPHESRWGHCQIHGALEQLRASFDSDWIGIVDDGDLKAFLANELCPL